MSLTSKQKSEVLESLHRFFNLTDEFPAEPGRSLEFSEQIKTDMTEIIKDGLYKNVTEWGKRCSEARKASKFSQEHVAEFLNVAHKSIQRQEEKNKQTDIDPFYLEAFSLIYQKSPYTLLGYQNPHFFCPFKSSNSQASKFSNVIISTLYDENSQDKLAYLETITRIGKLKLQKYKQLVSFLRDTTSFIQLFDRNPLDSPNAICDEWRKKQLPPLLDSDQHNSNEYNLRRVFWEAYYVFDDLEQRNPVRLFTLAQLALCDIKIANALSVLILDIGYPKDPKSLRNYHIEKLLIKQKQRRKKKATPLDTNSPDKKGSDSITSTYEQTKINTIIQNIVYYCPNRSLFGILENGQVLVHNGSSYSIIYGYSAKLTEFLLKLDYVKESDHTSEETQYNTLETDVKYRINLRDGHINGYEGWANLTDDQARQILQIIESVFSEGIYQDTLPLFQKRQYPLHRPESNA